MQYVCKYQSPMGEMLLSSDGKKLTGVWFTGQKYFAATICKEAWQEVCAEEKNIFVKTVDWLERYFKGERPAIEELSLAPKGSDFRQKVWKILCEIPYGEVVTYGDIAKRLARESGLKAMSAQAVGGAVGHNPISVIIPCHRVLGSNGKLTGYAGGVERKKSLLEHEKARGIGLSVQ